MKQIIFFTLIILVSATFFPGSTQALFTKKDQEKVNRVIESYSPHQIHTVFRTREKMREILRYMASRPDLFPTEQVTNFRKLSPDQRRTIRQVWESFLDQILAMDALGSTMSELYRHGGKPWKETAFRITYAAFLAQYRFAMDFITLMERDSSMHTLLNEEMPELGMPKNTYADFKYRFLNVFRGAEFARLNIIYRHYEGDPDLILTPGMDADIRAIWDAGKGRGPAQTFQNAVKIVQDTTFTAWFPVQKGVSEWMGDTRVWRPGISLIPTEMIDELAPELQPGDILLTRREWYLSNIGLPGYWSHAALYIGTPEKRTKHFQSPEISAWVKSRGVATGNFESLLKSEFPDAYVESLAPDDGGHVPEVIEAVGEGVVFTTLHHGAGADSLAVLRPNLSQTTIARALIEAFRNSGKPYDFNFDFLTDTELVCTELVYKSFESPGSDTESLRFPMTEIMGRQVVPANDIAKLFDRECDTPAPQLSFVVFLDGDEKTRTAIRKDVLNFRSSWKRPKWHILVPDTK